ncbi:MAG TPA: DUF3237 family protein [Sphingomonadaceae bacterium]|jgi:hypothetical protein|nr:DUF3237 family protein [Sphingomonadaceae bacterium]
MTEFTLPEITTKKVGELALDYVFRIEAEVDEQQRTATSRGNRLFQRILGGTVSGPKLDGRVYPRSGGEFGLGRTDGAFDLNTHFMVETGNGEMLYIAQTGISRDADGYYRFIAYCESEGDGAHAWLNDTLIAGTATPAADGRTMTFTYFAVS